MPGSKGLVIPPNSNTFSDWRRVCHVSWITKLKETTTWTFDSHVIRSCSLKPRKFVVPAGFKQIIFSHIFELGGITKHLRLAPRANSEFCFPSTSMLSVEVPEETKLTVALHWKAFCIPLSKCGALSIEKLSWCGEGKGYCPGGVGGDTAVWQLCTPSILRV